MKVPFQVLYNNDLTHILSCASPYHRHGEPFRPEMLTASVDETADTGIDAHLLQPGFGWVPLWQSKICPPTEHWAWLQKNYQAKNAGYLSYLLDGGDLVADFARRCRRRNLAPLVSFRMNDTHHLEHIDNPNCPEYAYINVCQFYQQHPEWRLETRSNSWRDRGQNWVVPEVREYKLSQLRELAENYDLDGLELDFMRYPRLFRTFETTSQERHKIVLDFIGDVRKMLGNRVLGMRIPAFIAPLDDLGFDLAELADAGVDYFTLSHHFFCSQTGDLVAMKQQAPQAKFYLEMTSCTSIGRAVKKGDGDTFEFHQTTSEQFYTTAEQGYAAGMDGVSLFNFVYYRQHGAQEKKLKTREPPFEIIKNFADCNFLGRQPKTYFIGSHWNDDNSLPKAMILNGQYANFTFRHVNPLADAELTVSIDNSEAGDWEAWFNDRPVFKIKNTMTWLIPRNFLNPGDNHIEFRSKDIVPSIIEFLELKIGE